MYKKIILTFIALIIFTLPMQKDYAYAIATKVATKIATQAVKEVIKDSAKEKAFKLALDEVGKIYNATDTYKFTDGYDTVCVTRTKADGTCDKPIQIKKDLDSNDMDKIDSSVTKKMDAKIGGALYASKWGKFLDWVVPIYAISGATVAIDYAINQEDSIAGMMNEIAMEALQDSGLVKEAELIKPNIVDTDGEIMTPEQSVLYDGQTMGIKTNLNAEIITNYDSAKGGSSGYPYQIVSYGVKPFADYVETSKIYVVDYEKRGVTQTTDVYYPRLYLMPANETNTKQQLLRVYEDYANLYPSIGMTVIKVNGETVYTANHGSSSTTAIRIDNVAFDNSEYEKTIIATPPRPQGTNAQGQPNTTKEQQFYYQKNGDIISVETERNWSSYNYNVGLYATSFINPTEQDAMRIMTFPYGKMEYIPYVPNWTEDLKEIEEVPIDLSVFKKDEETLKFPPISSMKITDENGDLVTHTKNNDTGETGMVSPNGTPVNEDSVNVGTGTGYTGKPDGSIEYTPQNPTTENPNKEPETIPKESTTVPPTEPPVTPTEPPLEPIPDGEYCDAKLQFPIFSPLKETFSTSFPFSIPWDIGRAIEAAFGNIGHEKPNVDLKLNVLGNEQVINITIPEFFDKWKPFTDTMLLLTFDVMIMFGVYRFVKGAGS